MEDRPNDPGQPRDSGSLSQLRARLVSHVDRVVKRLDDLDQAISAFIAATEDEGIRAAWAQSLLRPPRVAGRKPGRPLGSRDRWPRLPRGTLTPRAAPNGRDGQG